MCRLSFVFLLLFVGSCSAHQSAIGDHAIDPTLITLSDIVYEGAFRLPQGDFGESNISYAEGQIAFNKSNNSVFIVGHAQQQAIAEFAVPELSTSSNISDLHMSPDPIQAFSKVIKRVDSGNPQAIDRIGGMLYYEGKLIVNAYEYYDAPADNTHTTLIVKEADQLASSTIGGFYQIEGKAHAAGWMTQIPPEWREALGGEWIAGSSSFMPIISRLSVGPSAFVFDPRDFGVREPVETAALLNFSLKNPLHENLSNNEIDNDLWTHLSRAVIGFIPPHTSTYVTLGFSGGHTSGVCYKCIPVGSKTECGGHCARNKNDYHLMYWLWKVDDLYKVKKGEMRPHQVRPYEYGQLVAPFPTNKIGGGSFEQSTGRLFLTLQRADTVQTPFGSPPLVLVYRIK